MIFVEMSIVRTYNILGHLLEVITISCMFFSNKTQYLVFYIPRRAHLPTYGRMISSMERMVSSL